MECHLLAVVKKRLLFVDAGEIWLVLVVICLKHWCKRILVT